GLEGYWPFECSAMDVAGGRHGIFEGAPICTDGKFSKAFTFNGNTDFIKIPNTDTAPLYAKEGFSWCVWFKGSDIPTSTADGYGQLLISAADGGLGEDIILGFGNAYSAKNTLFFEVDSAGGFGGVMTQSPGWKPAAGWENNRWYHAVAVADYPNKVIILYVDGVERARKDFGGIPVDRNMNVSFGAFFDGSDRQGRFKGILDDIRIYRRALSQEDITALYELNVAQLAVSTEEIDFGTMICEYTSSSTFSITNAGPGDVDITDAIFSSGTNFSLSESMPKTILGGAQREFEIVFTANTTGIFYDTLLLDNSLGLPPIILHLMGQKDSLGTWLTAIVDFGKLENGSLDTKQAILVNTGTVPLDV
ncbi:MAG: choice-of-anchor D domain-containing protein, partial [Taibaiella sp.]|nr:choice-of-anchor D domain-containing protein [Taibaiella sp.]